MRIAEGRVKKGSFSIFLNEGTQKYDGVIEVNESAFRTTISKLSDLALETILYEIVAKRPVEFTKIHEDYINKMADALALVAG